jgi:hypothetical protein
MVHMNAANVQPMVSEDKDEDKEDPDKRPADTKYV